MPTAGAGIGPRDDLSVTGAFEVMWEGDMDKDTGADSANGLSGRVAGEYEDVGLYFFNLSLNWKLD